MATMFHAEQYIVSSLVSADFLNQRTQKDARAGSDLRVNHQYELKSSILCEKIRLNY